MAIFKCKMCGGTIEFEQGATVGVCDSCGTKQTLPRLDDEQRANLYGRANHFRRNSDYDKAMGIYEQILNEDKTDAEAYWSIVLCRYGVEYVEDPQTHRRVPTVNRAQYTSIFADADYQSALQYADTMQKSIYEAEAKTIDDIQKSILEISQKEEPFDVFICYKETDAAGQRTPDSVLANDLYHQLVQEGFKVFFSRITLEDKLGSEYEPYIFAALNSAKVMVVLGTKPEYFNAVWVKNEWSRFLTLVKNSNGKKMLIPAYKDMDPYDLPDAFSNLQAQDMAKLGFMQDLVRGIRKIVYAEESKPVKETVAVQSAAPTSSNYSGLLKRAYIFLEDGKWQEADEYCEKVLDNDPECAEAYLGKLMAELHISKFENLKIAAEPFDQSDNCKKASRYDAKLAKELADINTYIRERNETARKDKIYLQAYARCSEGTKAGYEQAAALYRSISGYKDAEKRAKECAEQAEEARKEIIYKEANAYRTNAKLTDGEAISRLESALQKYESILDYKDSRTKADECREKIAELKIKQEKEKEERKKREAEEAEATRITAQKRKKQIIKLTKIIAPIVAMLVVFLVVLDTVILPASNYNKAISEVDSENYEEAYSLFDKYPDYKDTQEQVLVAKKKQATALLSSEKYDEAYAIFTEIGETDIVKESLSERAAAYLEALDYEKAYTLLKRLGDTKRINESKKERAENYLESKDYKSAYALLEDLGDTDRINESKYTRAIECLNANDYETAYALFAELHDYKESKTRINEIFKAVPKMKYRAAEVGDTVTFGKYYQSEAKTKEEIEWTVLDKTEEGILVISRYVLDCMPFNSSKDSVTWDSCSLRKWLNGTFYQTAFEASEQSMIKATEITAEKSISNIDQGNDTTDKVFLLSVREANKYFPKDYSRKCSVTDYAISRGAASYSAYGGWPWWMRSPITHKGDAPSTNYAGGITTYDVNSKINCVRPVIWINTK